ncbi:hypothetical protein [Rhodococcus sp. MTM3W5.2]|uniref:hypothetical protein n=1 Tax=Rhodococcus sp. MTM3W5.2 TaxID=1805827 RepID=UPI001CB9ABA4|nr:hypothetical protein [Rhodococcus sp. MTM3W5.2]
MSSASQISEQAVVLAVDYGQFSISGGLGDYEDNLELLEQAQAAQPSAGNGNALVVLSPHQNNFEMPTSVQVWNGRPPADRDEWQQVSEGRLRVSEAGQIMIASPTTGEVFCEVPEGDYLIEVSGRGFVNYGWPGSTTPGDVWRIRMWPNDGTEPEPAQMWVMPGFGVPENSPRPEPAAGPVESDEPKWITVFEPGGGSRMVRTSELRAEAAEAQRQAWGGGDPIPEMLEYNGGQSLTKYDRALVLALLEMDGGRLREIARWCASKAYEFAGLADRTWVAPALAALHAGEPLPPPFDDIASAFAHLEADRRKEAPASEGSGQGVFVTYSSGEFDPFDHGPISRPSYALPTIFAAAGPDPRRAAFDALSSASVTFQRDARELHAQLRETFGIAPGPA